MPIQLYKAAELATIPWPETPDGEYARHYLGAMMQYGTARFIKNVDAEVYVIIVDNIALPVITPRTTSINCYVCSPTAHYITYARYESASLRNGPLQVVLYCLFRFLSIFMWACEMEKVVYVNNWLLSTNLYPVLSDSQVAKITDLVKRSFPDRVIIMRSLNDYTNRGLIEKLQIQGYQRIVSRQVYITNPAHSTYQKKKDFKNDYKFFNKTCYKIIRGNELNESDIGRVVKLYNDLYLQKYTHLNPQFSAEFIKLVIDHNLMTILCYSRNHGIDSESIDAVLGYFRKDGQMTTPIFGYDTAKPPSEGLYRLLSTLLVLESEKWTSILNQSSGASKFKMARGCTPHIEYSLFYDIHTSWRQRLGWTVVPTLVNSIAEPIMVRYQL